MKKETEPEFINSPLNHPMPNYNVYRIKKTESILVHVISFILGGLAGLVFYCDLFMKDGERTLATHISNTVVFIVIGLLAEKFLVPMYINSQLTKQKNQLKTQFCNMLESLTSSFSTGSNVVNAFEAATKDLKMQYDDKSFIVQEMEEILSGISQNINIEVMLKNFGERSGNEDISSFADVFEICYRKGGDMQSAIARTHSVITEKIAISDEIETKLTSNKMQHNVMSIMPIVLVAMLRMTNDAFASSFTSLSGVIVNTVAIGIFIGAYKYGLKIVNIKG